MPGVLARFQRNNFLQPVLVLDSCLDLWWSMLISNFIWTPERSDFQKEFCPLKRRWSHIQMWHRQSEQEKPPSFWAWRYLATFKHLGLGDLIESQCEAHWDCNGICLFWNHYWNVLSSQGCFWGLCTSILKPCRNSCWPFSVHISLRSAAHCCRPPRLGANRDHKYHARAAKQWPIGRLQRFHQLFAMLQT